MKEKAPWSLILSRYSREQAFLGDTELLTSPPPNRRFPHPPPAAPAAGGWGGSDSRCVHSVEWLRWSADGGAGRMAARPSFCFAGAAFPPRRRRSGGVPMWIRFPRRARSSGELLGATSPRRRSTAASPVSKLLKQAALKQARVDGDGAGWRPYGVRVPETSRPPGDIGRSKQCGDAAAARHRCDLFFVGVNAVQDLDLGVILSFVEVLSVFRLF
jgi:hypothetical protein